MAAATQETSLTEETADEGTHMTETPRQLSATPEQTPGQAPKDTPSRGDTIYTEFFGTGSEDDECFVLSAMERHLRKVFFKLGYRIGLFPVAVLTLPVILTVVCISGLHRIRYETDYDYLFSPVDLRAKEDRVTVERLFPVQYANNFDPARATQKKPAQILLWAKDNGTMLRTDVWTDVAALNEAVSNISISWDGVQITYESICAQLEDECIPNPVWSLHLLMPLIEARNFTLGYPLSAVRQLPPSFFGGVDFDEEKGHLISAKSVSLDYWFRRDDGVELRMWESQLQDLCQSMDFKTINVALLLRETLPEEMSKNAEVLKTYFVVLFILMTAYGALSTLTGDCVRSKPLLGFVGVVVSTLATGSAFGLLMHCGVPYIFVNSIIPILMLAIGLQDTYFILSTWQETSPLEEIPLRMGLTFSRAVWPITVTSCMALVAFFTSHATRLPVVQIFCLYFGICTLFKYLWLLTLFAGVLGLSGLTEQKRLHCLTHRVVKPKSDTGDAGCLYRSFCAGGVDPSSSQEPRDNHPHAIKIFFRDYVAAALNITLVKLIVVVLFGGYLIGAIATCFTLREDLGAHKLIDDDSVLHDFLQADDRHVKRFPDMIQIVITENLTYSDPYVMKLLLKLHSDLEALPDIWRDTLTQSWFRDFSRFVSGRPELEDRIKDDKAFISVLKKDYLPLNTVQELDIIFDAADSTIVASRFLVHRFDNDTSLQRQKDLVENVRQIVDQFPFDAVAFSPFFVDTDVYQSMGQTSAQTLCLSLFVMILLCFGVVPSPSSALVVALSIASIQVGVLGYASAWGVTLDMVSITALIVCVGMAAHHSIPVALAFHSAKAETIDGKLRQCLFHVGLPVLQGTLSTIVCILPLAFLSSYIFRAFFKLLFLVTVFGAGHALFFLPVVISSLGPGSIQRQGSSRLINA